MARPTRLLAVPPFAWFGPCSPASLSGEEDTYCTSDDERDVPQRVGAGVVLQEEDHVHGYLRGDPCRSAWDLPLAGLHSLTSSLALPPCSSSGQLAQGNGEVLSIPLWPQS